MNDGESLSVRVRILWYVGAHNEAIDTVYDELDDACLAGRFDFVRSSILALVQDEHCSPVLLSALTITLPFRSELGAVRLRAANRVRYLEGERAVGMLYGLETG